MPTFLPHLGHRPLAWSLLLAAAAGCASPGPSRVPPPGPTGAGRLALHVVPVVQAGGYRVQAGGYRVQAFSGWVGQDIATLTARLVEVGGAEVASATLGNSPLTGGAGPNGPGFDLGGLLWDKTYRVELRAYRANGGSSEAISVDDASSGTFDTNGVNGQYPTVKTLQLPVVLDERPFPGLLDVVVNGVASQDFMRVVLSPLDGAAGDPVATTVMLAGAGSATLSFGELEPNATYVVERFPYTGSLAASTPLAAENASTSVSTHVAAASSDGRVATSTVPLAGAE